MAYLGTKPQTATTLADNIVTADKIAEGAIVSDLGYTPANKAGDKFTGELKRQISFTTATETRVLSLEDTTGTNIGGSIRSYNDGGYKQDMRFYTTNASGNNEQLAMTLTGTGLVKPAKGLAPVYESAWVNITQGGNYFFSHGLGRQPYMIRVYAKWDNTDDNKPWLCVGDLGVWDNTTAEGADRGVVAGVSNSLICVAIGEGGIATDWGGNFNSGFPTNNNAFETYFNTYGQNHSADFMDTPTENSGVWGSAWFKVYAW